jgi:HemY protein
MKFILLVLLSLAAALGAAWLLDRDPGFVALSYGGYVIQTSFVVFAVAVVAVSMGLYLLIRLAIITWTAQQRLRRWRQQRNERRAQSLLTDGLERLAEGDWLEAERLLVKGAARASTPTLHYLGAAQAADLRHDPQDRDRYLQRARDQAGPASLAVGLAEVDVALREGRLDEAGTKLNTLLDQSPRHPQVLRLQARQLRNSGNWQALLELLPRLRKRHALYPTELAELEHQVWLGLVRDAPRERDELRRRWRRTPKAEQTTPSVAVAYAEALLETDAVVEAEGVLRQAIARHWEPALLAAYGRLPPRPGLQALNQAEAWLRSHPQDPHLLACLGELCVSNSLWAPARQHLEAALRQRPEPRLFHLLADALRGMGEEMGAADASRRGLALAVGGPGRSLKATASG